MYSKTTKNISITVKPSYLEDQSEPDEQHYVWAYQITINNLGRETVQLKNRYWKIIDSNGTNQEVTFKAKKFANRLHNHFAIPVETQDERLTTADAKARLFEQGGYRNLGKGNVDNMSAVIILESFFEQFYGD